MNKNIRPRNDKNERHGYWERYYYGNLWHKCFFRNGKQVGYEEWYGNSKLTIKNYHI
jgi:hypothetical protein